MLCIFKVETQEGLRNVTSAQNFTLYASHELTIKLFIFIQMHQLTSRSSR